MAGWTCGGLAVARAVEPGAIGDFATTGCDPVFVVFAVTGVRRNETPEAFTDDRGETADPPARTALPEGFESTTVGATGSTGVRCEGTINPAPEVPTTVFVSVPPSAPSSS